MSVAEPLLEALAESLPIDLRLDFHYISTAPTPCPALFSPPPDQLEGETTSENHFLTASRPSKEPLAESGIFVFGIEVLIFSTPSLTTIFVSKADSTGNLSISTPHSGSPSIIKTLCRVFLSFLVKTKLQGPRIVLSLFARAQPQYLFPGSSENPNKHILEDRQLIKWWARTIDPLLDEFSSLQDPLRGPMDTGSNPEAYLVVPGCDKHQTKSFFPSGANRGEKQRWANSYPVDLIVYDQSAPLRCLIPRLPDDPKARFLLDLDSEISEQELLEKGKWRSVWSLEQFWELMSYRQECSAGRLVGFLWVIITPSANETRSITESEVTTPRNLGQNGSRVQQLPTPSQSQSRISDTPLPTTLCDSKDSVDAIPSQSPPPSSPLSISAKSATTPTPERLATSNLPSRKSITPTTMNSLTTFKNSGSFPTLITPAAYEALQTHLLDTTDFSTPALATESTRSWTQRAAHLANLTVTPQSPATEPFKPSKPAPETFIFWGKAVTGRRRLLPNPSSQTSPSANPISGKVSGTPPTSLNPLMPVHVNTLGMSMIRKKRKAPLSTAENDQGATAAASSSSTWTQNPPIKIEGELSLKQGDGSIGEDGVNTLSTELVRKKRRATPGVSGMDDGTTGFTRIAPDAARVIDANETDL